MAQSQIAKILTIDDEFLLRQSIVAYLEDSGFTVLEAENGRSGLEIFRAEKPDLVLSDLQMPEMGGLEVLAHLTKEAPDTPVIVVSGAGGMSEVIEALRLGAWDYVTKPITDLAVLEHAICKSLERARLVAENKLYRRDLEIANTELKKNLAILEADQEAGRSVQTRLLPEVGQTFGDFQFKYRVNPSLYLSGDFVDYFKINDDHMGFYIADVSGHGSSSAFVTVLLKNMVHQILNRYQTREDPTILKPEKILVEISQEIHGSQLGKYLTIIYCVFKHSTSELQYSVGGHYPNPILLVGDNIQFLEGKGFPVGILKKVTYQSHTIVFPPHAKLILFSDGVMEIVPAKDMQEKEKLLLAMLKENKGDIDAVLTSLGVDGKKELPDDVTVMVLQKITQ